MTRIINRLIDIALGVVIFQGILAITGTTICKAADLSTYSLIVELAGRVYIADYDLSKDDCMAAVNEIAALDLGDGKPVALDTSAVIYCAVER